MLVKRAMSKNVVSVSVPGNREKVLDLMRKEDKAVLPVVDDNGDLVGIITSFDLVSNALIKLESDDPVENFMITTVPTTWYKTPLNVAFETMKQFGLKSVLALNDSAKLVGILTETDFIEESEIISERSEHSSTVGTEGDKWSWDSTSVLYIEKNCLKFTDKLVEDVGTHKVEVVNSKTKASDCAKKMKTLNIEQIPVIGVEGELIGLVRASDLIKALVD